MLISSHSFEGVDSFDWSQELPNIADYNIIILDTPRIFTFWSLGGKLKDYAENQYSISKINQIDKKVKSNLRLIKRKLVEILEFDVTVYALYIPNIIIGTKDRVLPASVTASESPGQSIDDFGSKKLQRSKWVLNSFVDTDAWCPISIFTVAEKGKKIVVTDEAYEEYFKNFRGWQYYFVSESLNIDELESKYESRWKVKVELSPIATNKINKPIAIELIPLFHKWARGWDEEEGGWEYIPKKIGARLVLLPVDNAYDTRPLIEVLLQRIKVFEKTPPPAWLGAIKIPGEASLENEIATKKQNLEAMKSDVKQSEDSLTELRKYKELLYETGSILQERVKSTLDKLGAKIEPSPVSDEFIIEIGGKKALIEVKGVDNKSVSKPHLSQLNQDMTQYRMMNNQSIKGILVGNSWRLHPLKQRDMPDKPIFTDYVVKVAPNQDIGLISTPQLFKAFCKMRKEPQCRKEVLNKIINNKGVITF